MTPDEFDHFLDQLISMRNLTIDDEQRGHWWDTLKDVEGPVFKEAVRRMISIDPAYPSSVHARQVCAEVMRDRLSRVVQPTPPSGLSTGAYSAWEREWRRQVVRGAAPHDARERALVASNGHGQLPSAPAPARAESRVIEGTVEPQAQPRPKW